MSTEKVLETTYHGLIKENETFVALMPQLRVVEGKICGFHIRNTHKGDIPFQVRAGQSREEEEEEGQTHGDGAYNCTEQSSTTYSAVTR